VGAGLASFAALAVSFSSHRALAKPHLNDECYERSVCGSRAAPYVGGHLVLLAGAGALAAITSNAIDAVPPAVPLVTSSTLGIADSVQTLELVLPVPVLALSMRQGEFFDATIGYGQVLLLSMTANHSLRRLFGGAFESPAFVGFAAAVSSAYLLDQRTEPVETNDEYERQDVDLRVRGAFWGVQLSLATANSILSVRGGRSHWVSPLVGAALGTGIAVGMQAAHACSFEHLAPSALNVPSADWGVWVFNFAALGAGVGLPFLADSAERDENLDIDYKLQPMNYGPGSVGLALTGKL
jgi:hypothetical protein